MNFERYEYFRLKDARQITFVHLTCNETKISNLFQDARVFCDRPGKGTTKRPESFKCVCIRIPTEHPARPTQ